MLYIDELITALEEYDNLKSQKEILDKQLSKKRSQIDKWLKINELEEYCIKKPSDPLQSWKIYKFSRTTTTPNWKVIYKYVPIEEHENLKITKKSKPTCAIRTVKTEATELFDIPEGE